jgi:hypothetical protein
MASRDDTLLLAAESLNEAGSAIRIARSRLRGGRYDKVVAYQKLEEAVRRSETVARRLRAKFGVED